MRPTTSLRSSVVRSLRSGFLGPLLVFLAAVAIYAPTASTAKIHVDVASSALGGFRIATTGEPWLDDVHLDDFPVTFGVPLWVGEAPNGHTVVMRTPGPIAAAVPAYFLSGGDSGVDDFRIAPQALTAALLAAITIMLVFLALRPRLGNRRAATAAAVLAFATPMWSVDADALWTHTITTLGIAGMAWSASRDRWWLVGVFGGIGIWGRLHVALIVALLGLGLGLWRRRPEIVGKVAVPSALLLGLSVLWSHWMYGNWSLAGGYNTGAIASAAASEGGNGTGVGFVNQLGLWFALDRGLLIWTPLLAVLLPAVVRSWSSLPDWTRMLLVGGVAYTLVQGRLNPFHGGDSYWGYRLGLEALLCAAPAYACAARGLRRWERLSVPVVVAAQGAAISYGALSEATYLTTDQMWRHNSFVEALLDRPGVWVWLALWVLAGVAAAVLLQRRSRAATA